MIQKIMKMLLLWISIMCLQFSTHYALWSSVFTWDDASITYCQNGECWLKEWIETVKRSISDIDTTSTFSEKIQEIIVFLLTFLTLVAVIYIMYAWFKILVSNGEDEAIKKSKKTIIYVIVWIVVIWFAYTIATFALRIAASGSGNAVNTTSTNSATSTSCAQRTTRAQCENSAFWICNWSNSSNSCSIN
jgi:hypothetical protein